MNIKQKLARNTAIQLIGKVVSTLFGLLAVAILTRYLGVEKFGWYVTATGFLQFTGILVDFGFTVTTSSMLSNSVYDKTKLLNNIFTLRFITGLFFNTLAAGIIFLFPYSLEIKIAVAILSISFFFISLNQVFWGYFQKNLKMIIPVIAEVLSRLALVVGLVLAMKVNSNFLILMGVITLASGVMTLYMFLNVKNISFYLEKKLTVSIVRHMWPLAIAVIFNAIYLNGDKLLLPLYVDQVSVGLYGAAYRVIEIVIQVMALTIGILMPVVANAWNIGDTALFKKHYQLTFDAMVIIVMPMMVGLLVLAKPIMILIAGNDFASASKILQLLTIAIFGVLFGIVFSHLALAISKQRYTMWAYAVTALLSVILYLYLIPKYGVWGAAATSVIAELFSGLLLFIITTKLSKVLINFTVFFKILFISILMGLIIYYIKLPHVLLSVILGLIVYIFLLLLFRIVSRGNILDILKK